MQSDFPRRKDIRLKHYDYSQTGYYFVTICTEEKKHLLCDIVESVGVGFHADPKIRLTSIGEAIEESLNKLSEIFNGIQIDEYIIMPNHIHFIVILEGGNGNPPLQDVVGRMKSFTTNQYNKLKGTKYLTLWQRNYYEHVIRNNKELLEIREYIVNNPVKWKLDKYYSE